MFIDKMADHDGNHEIEPNDSLFSKLTILKQIFIRCLLMFSFTIFGKQHSKVAAGLFANINLLRDVGLISCWSFELLWSN